MKTGNPTRMKACVKDKKTARGVIVSSIMAAVALFFMTPLDEIFLWVPLATMLTGSAVELSTLQSLGLFFGLISITSSIFYIIFTMRGE